MSRPVEDDANAWNIGRYTLYGEIASGGMATVHIGRMAGAAGFAKLVAIKRMHPQFAKDEDFLAMFLDEARLATRIRHPNVVQILDVIADAGEVLIVMEYIHGDALSRINRVLRPRGERIPMRVAVAICAGALHGLHAAHEAKSERGEPLGIVHRDVSPQNILVGTDGVARVIDFGIAKAADQVHMTREGELKGKLVYMAPEQLMGEPVSRQTDIFAMTIVLWESLTGVRMFDTTDSTSPIAARARQHTIEPPSSVVPDLSPEVDAIVMKGLALSPKDRWESARAMAVALEEAFSPATPAQVGAWVEQVAQKSLLERQQRIDEIELKGADASVSTRQMAKDLKELGSERLFTRDVLSSEPGRASRTPPPPPPRASNPAVEPRVETGRRLRVPSALPPEAPPRPTPIPPRPPLPSRPVAPPISSDPFEVPPAPPLEMPRASMSLEAPVVPTTHAAPAKVTVQRAPTQRRMGPLIVFLLVAGLVGFIFWTPSLLRKNYVAAAAAHGFTLTVDDVDLLSHPGSIDLVGATLTSSELPGVVLHAKTLQLAVDARLEPTGVIARDVEVTIDQSFSSLEGSLTRFGNKHPEEAFGIPGSVASIHVDPAHVVWTQPAGPGTRLEVRTFVLDVNRAAGRKLGDDFLITPTSVTLSTPLGPMGPWLVSLQKTSEGLRSRVSFDEKSTQNAGLDIASKDGKTTLDLRAVHASPSELAIKPEAVNALDGDVPPRIDLTAHVTYSVTLLDASFDMKAEGWRTTLGPPSMLTVSGSVHGEPTKALDLLDAKVGLGAPPTPVVGSVTVAEDGIAIKATGTGTLKCEGYVTGSPINLAFDTRDVGKWGLGLPRGCPKK